MGCEFGVGLDEGEGCVDGWGGGSGVDEEREEEEEDVAEGPEGVVELFPVDLAVRFHG